MTLPILWQAQRKKLCENISVMTDNKKVIMWFYLYDDGQEERNNATIPLLWQAIRKKLCDSTSMMTSNKYANVYVNNVSLHLWWHEIIK